MILKLSGLMWGGKEWGICKVNVVANLPIGDLFWGRAGAIGGVGGFLAIAHVFLVLVAAFVVLC